MPEMPEATQPLSELASLIRSKNAGPFWITLDAFFATDEDYRRASAPGVLTEQAVAELYHVPAAQVRVFRLPTIRVVKVSFPRPVVQGGFTDRDMHSGQQHIPLGTLRLPDKQNDKTEPRSDNWPAAARSAFG
jgi:hypothetical protein